MSMARLRTAVTAARPSSPSLSTWWRRRREDRRPTDKAASAASAPGATLSSSSCSAPPPCRSAPRSCTAASASSMTCATACRDISTKGPELGARACGTQHRPREALGTAGPELPRHRARRAESLHRLWPVLHRLQRWRAPSDRRQARRSRPYSGRILEHKCVGCNLCSLVCPVENCITMQRIDAFGDAQLPWTDYSKNPGSHPHVRSNRHDPAP